MTDSDLHQSLLAPGPSRPIGGILAGWGPHLRRRLGLVLERLADADVPALLAAGFADDLSHGLRAEAVPARRVEQQMVADAAAWLGELR